MLDAALQATVLQGWKFSVSDSDDRTWLTITTPQGSHASLGCATNHASGETIPAQVLHCLRDALATPLTSNATAQSDRGIDAIMAALRDAEDESTLSFSAKEMRAATNLWNSERFMRTTLQERLDARAATSKADTGEAIRNAALEEAAQACELQQDDVGWFIADKIRALMSATPSTIKAEPTASLRDIEFDGPDDPHSLLPQGGEAKAVARAGWKLMPTTLTREMLDASGVGDNAMKRIYNAMLATPITQVVPAAFSCAKAASQPKSPTSACADFCGNFDTCFNSASDTIGAFSRVAPKDYGPFWHWSGKAPEGPELVRVTLNNNQDAVIWRGVGRSGFDRYDHCATLGGYWARAIPPNFAAPVAPALPVAAETSRDAQRYRYLRQHRMFPSASTFLNAAEYECAIDAAIAATRESN